MQERLQKIIARAGVASRRAGEEIILAGRVRVNGHVITELGAKADLFADKIEVDGQRLVAEAPRYIVLHKPRNVVSTLADPEGRPTVADLLRDAGGRLYPVGRLDFATSGVLLVTNDGDFANALLHPRGGVPKTYVLKVHGLMAEEDLERWRTGVALDDGKTLPAEVRKLRHEDDKTWIEITLREGRNQQIRRMGEATGFPVMRLARLSFAGVTSEGLRPGEWRPISTDELMAIRKSFGVPKRIRGASMAGPQTAPGRHGPERTLRSERAAQGRPDARQERTGRPRRSAPAGEREAAPNRRDASPKRRDSDPNRRDAAPNRRDAAPNRRDAAPNRRDAAPNRRDAAPNRRDAAPNRRDAAPNRRDAAPNRREAAPNRREAAPNRREAAPNRREAAPNRREAAPNRREAAPNRREATAPGRPRKSRSS